MRNTAWASAAAVAGAFGAIGAAPAVADDLFTPNGLTPIGGGGGGQAGPVGTAGLYGGTGYYCNKHVEIAARPNSFYIGTCMSNATFINSGFQNVDGPYWGGEIFGDVNTCGWLNTTLPSTGGTGVTSCPDHYNINDPHPYWDYPDYIDTASNCRGLAVWSTSPCNQDSFGDGTGYSTQISVAKNGNCQDYLNLQPWTSAGGPEDADPSPLPSGTSVGVRYRTKYAYQGKSWFVINVFGRSGGNDKYVFVPGDCLPSLPAPNG